MDKSILAFVWIAGPISGVLVQPYIGIKSDSCRIQWGKRKPFMVGGAVATALSFLALAWTREIVHGFLGLFGADPNSRGVKVTSIVFAVVLIYILDVAINAGIVTSPDSCYPVLIWRNSSSCSPRFHGRQCSHASTRRYQFLGWTNDRGRKHRLLRRGIYRPS